MAIDAIDDLFDKFEKGEVRLAEQEVVDPDFSEGDGTVDVTIDNLVSVEEVVTVLIDVNNNADDPDYQTIAETSVGPINVVGADASVEENNTVEVTAYDNSSGTDSDLSTASNGTGPNIKVIARGY